MGTLYIGGREGGRENGDMWLNIEVGLPAWPPLAAQCRAVEPDLSRPLGDTYRAVRHHHKHHQHTHHNELGTFY